MYKCDICGRELNKKIRSKGYTLCYKHAGQIKRYGGFFDVNPRTVNDFNEIVVDEINEIATVFLYDSSTAEKIGEFIIDLEDLEKIRYKKWRQSYGHIVTGSGKNQPRLTHILMGLNKEDGKVVDHIDGNPYNNRKSNLRVCTQGENTLNKHYMSRNTSGVIGVSYDRRKDRRKKWVSEIRFKDRKFHLGTYLYIEEAAYARYVAQNFLFKEFSNNDNFKNIDFNVISIVRRQEIENYVLKRCV